VRFVRFYSSPAPVEEAVKSVASDSFVTSAVVVPPQAPVAELGGMFGQNEGFTKLLDPLHWSGAWDPIYWFIQGNFELVHTLTGLPWWGALVATAAAWRILSFPLQVKQTHLTAKTQAIQPELAAIRLKYMYAGGTQGGPQQQQKTGLFSESAQKMQLESQEVMKKHGVGMFQGIKYAFPQAFLMLSGFFVLRYVSNNDTEYLHQFFQNGGDFWFQNIAIADPTLVLPLLSSITTCALFAITPMPQYSKRTVLLIAAGLAAASFSFTYSFPAAIHLFWAGSSTFTLISTALLRQDAVRKVFGIPPLDPTVAAAMALKPVLFDQPLSHRQKIERVAVPPQTDANSSTSSSSKPSAPSSPTAASSNASDSKKKVRN